MNFQNNRYTLRFAEKSDNSGIRAVFESECFDGGISIQYLRGENPFDSFCSEGERPQIMVIQDNEENKIIAVGGAVVRTEFVNGKPELCGYLTGLKIHSDYRGKIRFIAKAYQFMFESLKDCRYFYTTILDDNTGAISFLEKGHRNMPEYKYLGHYTTYCFNNGKKLAGLEKNNLTGFDDIFTGHFRKFSFTPCDYSLGGFGEKTFYSLRENGKISACCFLCNQQEGKQYKMSSYGGIYRLISRLPTQLLGYPKFPKPDSLVNYGTVAYLYIKDNNRKLCRDFLRGIAADSGFDILIWGGYENNPLCEVMDSMKTVHYGSRLYQVVHDDVSAGNIDGPVGVEAALL